MGEYIKHVNTLDEDEIKIAVYRGGKADTWFSKEILRELCWIGYGDHRGGINIDNSTLQDLIVRYEQYDTSYIKYKKLIEVHGFSPQTIERIKRFVTEENIGFVLWNGNNKVLVIADQYVAAFEKTARQKRWKIETKEYVLNIELEGVI
jgi:hypothetical protein